MNIRVAKTMTIKVTYSLSSYVTTILLVALFVTPAEASEHVRGHLRASGKYVAPHSRTHANSTQRDNWSSKGNANLYTGKRGHRNVKK
jgi:hypothetical protein